MIHDPYLIRLYSSVQIGWYISTVIQEETNCHVIVNLYHAEALIQMIADIVFSSVFPQSPEKRVKFLSS